MMKLSDAKVRNAKPREKDYKIADGLGMYLLVKSNGRKYWRGKYYLHGKEKKLSLGVYPQTTLKDARDKWLEAKRKLSDGLDPKFKFQDKSLTLDGLWNDYLTHKGVEWAESHRSRQIGRMEKHILPKLGLVDPNSLEPPYLLEFLRCIEQNGTIETAHRVLNLLSQVFSYGIAKGVMKYDPSVHLKSVLKKPSTNNYPVVLDETRLGQILRMFDDNSSAGIIVGSAMRILPLVFQRPGELRQMKWEDLSLDSRMWVFQASKKKKDKQDYLSLHTVPLSRQVVDILTDLKPITGAGTYVFPSPRTLTRPLSDAAINAGMRSLGIPKEELTGHSWRAIARTILDERMKYRVDIIEHQLAHSVRDSLGRAYNRTTFLPERAEMMQAWADYLDGLKFRQL